MGKVDILVGGVVGGRVSKFDFLLDAKVMLCL